MISQTILTLTVLPAGASALMSALSCMKNDAAQTLGTYITSNKRLSWLLLALLPLCVLNATVLYAFFAHDGRCDYGRLNTIPMIPVTWWHALAPMTVYFCTKLGMPISTSFMTLSVFASGSVIQSMVWKSWNGYAYAFVAGFLIWSAALFGPAILWWTKRCLRGFLAKRRLCGKLLEVLRERGVENRLFSLAFQKRKRLKAKDTPVWRVVQSLTTSYLLWAWLRHDLANVFVFLPRPVPPLALVGVLTILNIGMLSIFKRSGGEIAWSVEGHTQVKDIRSATAIDVTYATILWYFQKVNDIPMSTTWVFFGLLAGREIVIACYRAFVLNRNRKDKDVADSDMEAPGNNEHKKHMPKHVKRARNFAQKVFASMFVGLVISLIMADTIKSAIE
ncbi:MAG: hypothetical protein COV07_01520 [Candidatus Vogelbacteria bacterium CG10_big_fil_rev_8_21_14_0_10_45_14]|uniref:Uncharacterized protein n=1 Tax=Candidatus Vogelbacteria bacterium CG10_big_fil_rev_8_21_14_0_10_45_14 TaxID=1975042 RepID=A0A2H0RK80_9BACT|nr:MAG: hypothetical protein COV07_01520 [Candidatus Vogelbacteria bacterium CG10_big_fil_rev_8_21_14_0_10_45_14]